MSTLNAKSRKFLTAIALCLLAGSSLATKGGEGDNTNCNGQGNQNSPCAGNGGNGGNGGSGGMGGAGGNGTGVGVGIGVGVAGAASNASASNDNRNTNTSINTNANNNTNRSTSVAVSGASTTTKVNSANTNIASGGVGHGGQGGAGGSARADGGSAVAEGGRASIGDITTAAQGGSGTGGNADQSQSASTGASTSTSLASTDGNSQNLTVNYPAAPSEVRIENTPDAYAVISSPTAPCRVAFGAGGSVPGLGLSLGGSILDTGCDTREDSRLLHNLGLHAEAINRLCQKPEMAAALGEKRCPKQEVKQESASAPTRP